VDYGIGQSVDLLPFQTRQQIAGLYQQSQIVVSLTTHDGTPNTLLEALACGCFPVAGDLESLREWITHGENGLLVGAGDAVTLAEAMILAFSRPELRNQAAEINQNLIRERAEYGKVMSTASSFYQALVNH
jgi:glycosyltransferase involved in cell wall biosynthesis